MLNSTVFINHLNTIEIETDFIESQLQDLLDAADSHGTEHFPLLILDAIRRHDFHVSDYTEAQITADHRGESLDQNSVRMRPTWNLSAPLRKLLIDQYRTDPDLVTRESISFRQRILSVPLSKQKLSLHWGRSFLEYFISNFLVNIDTKIVAENQPPLSINTVSKERIDRLLAPLIKQITVPRGYWYPDKWQPSKYFGLKMLELGIPQELTFNTLLQSFRNECSKQKIPLSKAEYKYKQYLLDRRSVLVKLERKGSFRKINAQENGE